MKQLSCLLLILVIFLQAEVQSIPKKTANARFITAVSPEIDGALDEKVWQDSPAIDGFVQHNPVEGAEPTERTAYKVLYDNKNIYIGIIAYDGEPAKIAAQLSRRDDMEQSDMLAIGLDSYHDQRTAFVFGLNAAGVKFDQIISEDGENEDQSWDPVWEGRCAITDFGWTAEMRIPYSQIRFSNQPEQTWGFQVYRKIFRKQEELFWQGVPKDAPGFVSYFGELKGVKNIHPPKRIEILPYSVASVNRYEKEDDNPFADGMDGKFNGGVDGKIGISSDITMDFTINPDFGQVEADPSEVNLSAFETFFEEKRPFFIEGKNIFQYPLAMGDGDMASETLFYSRRIGRSPHYYPDEDDFDYDNVDQPDNTRILGALKLSGKTKNGWSIGLLDAVTNREHASLDLDNKQRKIAVEPLTNYFVSRLQKDYNDGNTSLGGMLTAVNRKIEDNHLDYLNKSAYTGGIDFRHQWDKKTYFLELKLAGSHLIGEPEAIEEVQTASARYFQRPDADHLKLDTDRTSLSGHGGSYGIGRIGNGRWRFMTGGLWRSPGFETNDIGYLRRADQFMHWFWGGYRINNPVGIFRNVNINMNEWQGFNFGGDRLFMGGNINGGAQFLNYWGFFMGINRQQEGLSPFFLRGGPMTKTEGSWNNFFRVYSDSRKALRFEAETFMNNSDDGISKRFDSNISMFFKVNDKINVRFEPFYTKRIENLQYIDTQEMNGEDRYLFGYLKQNTFGMVFRLNYSLTPDLSIQYFGQPFVSAGDYSKFKQITRPKASGRKRYELYEKEQISLREVDDTDYYFIDENLDGISDYDFEQPDFNYKQFLSNLVVRWEYLPGSTLYLVWSQSRTGYDEMGRFSLNNDMQDLFDTVPNNVWLIKMNYWFSL